MSIFKKELANAIRSMSDETLLELAAHHLNGSRPKRKYTRRTKAKVVKRAKVVKKATKKRRARRK